MINMDMGEWIYGKRLDDVFSRIIAQETDYYKAVIMMGQSAVKSSLFINSGALATAMAFFNTNVKIIEDGVPEYIALSDTLILAMAIWLLNILLCVIAYGCAYLSEQRSYVNFMINEEKFRHAVIESKEYYMPVDKESIIFGKVACICIAITYLIFTYSIWICYKGFSCFINSF